MTKQILLIFLGLFLISPILKAGEIKLTSSSAGEVSVELPAGFYIVYIDGAAQKIVVR